jgi:hypothetical protein
MARADVEFTEIRLTYWILTQDIIDFTSQRKLVLFKTPAYFPKNFPQKVIRFILIFTVALIGLLYAVQPGLASVTYLDFATNSLDDSVLIEWWTASEEDNSGFYIWRALQADGIYERISPFFTSEADEGSGAYYYYFDDTALPGIIYYYRLEAIPEEGNSEFYGPITGSVINPSITATTVRSATPTRINTGTGPSATASISTPSPTAQPFTTATATITPARTQPNTPGIPTLTGTVTPIDQETNTPTVTTTLEPLPTIQLLFPVTQTELPLAPTEISRSIPSQTPELPAKSAGTFSNRLVALGVIISLLWLCLGAFLVLMVRKLDV